MSVDEHITHNRGKVTARQPTSIAEVKESLERTEWRQYVQALEQAYSALPVTEDYVLYLGDKLSESPDYKSLVANLEAEVKQQDKQEQELERKNARETRDVTEYTTSKDLAVLLADNPSMDLLEEVRSKLLLSEKSRLWINVVRASRGISSGSYGKVYKGHLVFPGDDEKVISAIEGGMKSGKVVEAVVGLLTQARPHLAIKEGSGYYGDTSAELHHEQLVLRELRPLRSTYTALPYYYGGGECNGKTIERAKNVLATCSGLGGGTTSYMLQEYEDGVTLDSAILTGIDQTDMLLTLMVIHSFLHTAWLRYGFVHCDLHPNNIILKGYDKGQLYTVPYLNVVTGESEYVLLPFVPVIIDYGLSVTRQHTALHPLSSSPYQKQAADLFRLYYSIRRVYDWNKSIPAARREVEQWTKQLQVDRYMLENSSNLPQIVSMMRRTLRSDEDRLLAAQRRLERLSPPQQLVEIWEDMGTVMTYTYRENPDGKFPGYYWAPTWWPDNELTNEALTHSFFVGKYYSTSLSARVVKGVAWLASSNRLPVYKVLQPSYDPLLRQRYEAADRDLGKASTSNNREFIEGLRLYLRQVGTSLPTK